MAYQRASDNRWVAPLTLTINGKKTKKPFYGSTEKEAEGKKLKFQIDLAKGVPAKISKQKLADYLDTWLDNVRSNIKERSYEDFSQIVRLHLKPELGHLPLKDLTALHVQSLITLKLKTLSPQTVVHIRMVLRLALQQAVRYELCHKNVVDLTDPPRVPKVPLNTLSAQEVIAFLEAAKGTRFYPMFIFLFHCAVRRGEALALTYENLNFENRKINIVQACQRIGGRMRITELKTESARRTIMMNDTVYETLLAMRNKSQGKGLIFNKGGKPIDPFALARDYKKFLKAAGISRNIRLHDARHTGLSLLLEAGVDLKTVSMMAGHSSTALTTSVYQHVNQQMMQTAADRMNLLLQVLPPV